MILLPCIPKACKLRNQEGQQALGFPGNGRSCDSPNGNILNPSQRSSRELRRLPKVINREIFNPVPLFTSSAPLLPSEVTWPLTPQPARHFPRNPAFLAVISLFSRALIWCLFTPEGGLAGPGGSLEHPHLSAASLMWGQRGLRASAAPTAPVSAELLPCHGAGMLRIPAFDAPRAPAERCGGLGSGVEGKGHGSPGKATRLLEEWKEWSS